MFWVIANNACVFWGGGGGIAILPACQKPVKCDAPGATITPSSVDLAKQHNTHSTQLTLECSLIGWLVVICISVFAMPEDNKHYKLNKYQMIQKSAMWVRKASLFYRTKW